MPKIYPKSVNGKRFYYLFERISLGGVAKKMQVYIGKSVPKNLKPYYQKMIKKETEFVFEYLEQLFEKDEILGISEFKKWEELRIRWKYKMFGMTEFEKEKFWRKFAVEFIFESNSIEGSRLSEREVSSIVNRGYIKKSLNRKEIQEVVNSMQAFHHLKSGDFKINQRSIIALHAMIVRNLGVKEGYKKVEIIVNNRFTVMPGEVRGSMASLLKWFKKQKKSKRHPLLIFADFHQKFERIHPFEDGNGRTGRLLFNWMLLQSSYPPILFRKKNRDAYFKALDNADEGRKQKWYRMVSKVYKKSVEGCLEL